MDREAFLALNSFPIKLGQASVNYPLDYFSSEEGTEEDEEQEQDNGEASREA